MDKKEILKGASKGLKKKHSFFARVWSRIKNANKLIFFNIALLLLVIAMLVVMIDSIKKQETSQKVDKPTAIATNEIQNNRPTLVIARNTNLPLRRKATVPEPLVIRQIIGNVIIDGKNINKRVREMTTINGNLYLQNLSVYTLPCGTHINGNLYLRNVKMLKFCGSFRVMGDIYVSRESSFGPIPKNASLGGQIVF